MISNVKISKTSSKEVQNNPHAKLPNFSFDAKEGEGPETRREWVFLVQEKLKV